MSNNEYKYCPYCYEEVSKNSFKCRFCKSVIKKTDKNMPSLEYDDTYWLTRPNSAKLSTHKPNSQGAKSLPSGAKYAGKCVQVKPNGAEETNYPRGKVYRDGVKNIERNASENFACIYARNPNGEWKNGKQIRLPCEKEQIKPITEARHNAEENKQNHNNRDKIRVEIEKLFDCKEKAKHKIDWNWVKHGCGRDWHLHEAHSVYKGINVNCFDSLKHAERKIFFTYGLDNRLFNSESDLIKAIEEVIKHSNQKIQ